VLEQIAGDEESLTVVCLSAVGVVAILLFGVGWTIVTILKVLTHTRLKHEMLERGMSPQRSSRSSKPDPTSSKETGTSPPSLSRENQIATRYRRPSYTSKPACSICLRACPEIRCRPEF